MNSRKCRWCPTKIRFEFYNGRYIAVETKTGKLHNCLEVRIQKEKDLFLPYKDE